MHKEIKKTIKDAFKKTRYKVAFGDGWVNVRTPKDIHCEFYPCGDEGETCYLHASYRIKAKETSIDLYMLGDVHEFVSICDEILKNDK